MYRPSDINTISYDTVLLKIQSDGPTDDFYYILQRAATLGTVRRFMGDEYALVAECWCGNLQLKATPLSLTLAAGSLAKWHRSENLTGGLTPDALDIALGSLDRELGLKGTRYSFREAKVLRIDLAANLVLRNAPYHYLQQLGDLEEAKGEKSYTGAKRRETGITYKLRRSSLCVYDKLAEMRANREPRPGDFKPKNVLRIEHRIKSPTGIWADVQTYTNPTHYKRLISGWYDYAIQLTNTTTIPPEEVDNMDLICNELAKWAYGQAVYKMGLSVYAARLNRRGLTKDAKSKALKKAREAVAFYLKSLEDTAQSNELSDELHEAIQQAHADSAALYPE